MQNNYFSDKQARKLFFASFLVYKKFWKLKNKKFSRFGDPSGRTITINYEDDSDLDEIISQIDRNTNTLSTLSSEKPTRGPITFLNIRSHIGDFLQHGRTSDLRYTLWGMTQVASIFGIFLITLTLYNALTNYNNLTSTFATNASNILTKSGNVQNAMSVYHSVFDNYFLDTNVYYTESLKNPKVLNTVNDKYFSYILFTAELANYYGIVDELNSITENLIAQNESAEVVFSNIQQRITQQINDRQSNISWNEIVPFNANTSNTWNSNLMNAISIILDGNTNVLRDEEFSNKTFESLNAVLPPDFYTFNIQKNEVQQKVLSISGLFTSEPKYETVTQYEKPKEKLPSFVQNFLPQNFSEEVMQQADKKSITYSEQMYLNSINLEKLRTTFSEKLKASTINFTNHLMTHDSSLNTLYNTFNRDIQNIWLFVQTMLYTFGILITILNGYWFYKSLTQNQKRQLQSKFGKIFSK